MYYFEGQKRSVGEKLCMTESNRWVGILPDGTKICAFQLSEKSQQVWSTEEQVPPGTDFTLVYKGYRSNHQVEVTACAGKLARARYGKPANMRNRSLPRIETKTLFAVLPAGSRYQVTNITYNGAGLEGMGANVRHGEVLALELWDEDEFICRIEAIVCHVTHQRLGIRVLPNSKDFVKYQDFASGLLHLNTQASGHVVETWELYVDSGYLSLSGKSPNEFSELKSAFIHTTQQLARYPHIGYHVCWPSQRGAEASVTNLRAYQRTHLGFQMAKRPGRVLNGIPGKQILQEIHWHLLELSLASSLVDYWIGYVQEETRFSNLLFCAFQELHRNPEAECVVPFQPLEIACDGMPSIVDPSCEIGVATAEELALLDAHIKTIRLRPYWEAQDFTSDRFELTALKAEWGEAELMRDRQILVARRAGRAAAFAVLDVAQNGLHLYNLIDQVRFFAVSPEGEALCLPLLSTARDWYVEHGKKKFHYFFESHEEPQIQGPWVKNLGRASLCIIGMQLIPDLLEYLFEVLAWDPKEFASMLPPAPTSEE